MVQNMLYHGKIAKFCVNHEELENICVIYIWEWSGVNFCTKVVHKHI